MDLTDASDSSDIGVAVVLRRITSGWKAIVLAIIVALAGAVVYLNLVTYRYSVEMRVVPVAPTGGDGLSSKLSTLGGLAAVAGVSLPDSSSTSSFKLYVESLHSRDVADILARDPAIMHGVFASEWDARTKAWRAPEGFVRSAASAMMSTIGVPTRPWSPPGAARLERWIDEQVVVDQSLKTPVVTISMASTDPVFAARLLDTLDRTADGLMRQRTLLRTEDYIRYLSGRLPTVSLAEQRIAIAQALGEQERIKMVASSERPFVADVFEHPAASERPVTPVPLKVLSIALVLGIAAGIGLAVVLPARWRSAQVIE